MAGRALLQRMATPASAAVLAGSMLYPRAAHAEAPDPAPALGTRPATKKPIYDEAESWNANTRTPARSSAPSASRAATTSTTDDTAPGPRRRMTPTDALAAQMGRARLFLHRHARAAEDATDAAARRAFALEKSLADTVAALAPGPESGERLLPGAVYVLVAAMAGSMLARGRGILVRGAAPLALGWAAAAVVLPVTLGNVASLLGTYEERVPVVADAHARVSERLRTGVRSARVHAELGRAKVEETVRDARETVEGWVRKGK